MNELLSERDFRKQLPILYGAIKMPNGQIKTGFFKALWDKWSNSMCYSYFTFKGNKGSGGFTLGRAYTGYQGGWLKAVIPGQKLQFVGMEEVTVPELN